MYSGYFTEWNWITQYVTFLSLSVKFSLSIRFIHVVACITVLHSFLLRKNVPSDGWLNHVFLIHSSVEGHLGCFHCWVFWITLLRIFTCKFFCGRVFTSPEYIARSGLAESQGDSILSLSRKCRAIFQSHCTMLRSHQQGLRVPIYPHPFWHVIICLLITAILMDGRCISLWFGFVFLWWPVKLSIFSHAYWQLLLRKVYLDLLPI